MPPFIITIVISGIPILLGILRWAFPDFWKTELSVSIQIYPIGIKSGKDAPPSGLQNNQKITVHANKFIEIKHIGFYSYKYPISDAGKTDLPVTISENLIYPLTINKDDAYIFEFLPFNTQLSQSKWVSGYVVYGNEKIKTSRRKHITKKILYSNFF